MPIILEYIFRFLFMFVGGFAICMAIEYFYEGRYFWCGWWIMFALYEAMYLFKSVMST